MLDEYIAQKMINQFSKAIDYNINIMDENGIIVASGDPTRVGTFHEVAHQMVISGKKLMEVYDDQQLMGTKSGVNMALEYRNSVIGIVGVTGNPAEAGRVATLLKAALENMYEFEMIQKAAMARSTRKDRLFQQLIYFDAPVSTELIQQASELGYCADGMRIPILIAVEDEHRREEVASICKSSDLHSKQDMLIRTEKHLLVFLSLRKSTQVNAEYRCAVACYLAPIVHAATEKRIKCRFLVGTMQNELAMYHVSYQHCMWMLRSVPPKAEIDYFYDHVQEYMQSCVPPTELRNMFKAYASQQPDKFWDAYKHIISTMRDNMNNMVTSSEELHMHKNTLVYQYNKIRNTLGIDPLSDIGDSDFAYHLCCFLKKANEGRL